MAPSAQSYSRSHSLLLLQKLLSLRDNASPFTLILDTLEQGAGPLVREFTSRAKASRSKVIFVSFATVRRPRNADVFVKARGKTPKALRSEIASHCPQPKPAAQKDGQQRAIIIIDSLNTLAAASPRFLSAFLSSIVTPAASVVAVYHADVPLVLPRSFNEYEPHPLTVLGHLSTAVLRVSSLAQAGAKKRARDRSLQEPGFGLDEGREGVLVGLTGPAGSGRAENGAAGGGIVLEMELRRRSGRAVTEKFVLTPTAAQQWQRGIQGVAAAVAAAGTVTLLSDHPMLASPEDTGGATTGTHDGEDDMETTFSLGLTEKQRRDREGVVLPFFDAQTDIGAGEGGRILYEMGREDDFDDEEDEI